jgi:hypothetical protein
MSALNAKGDVDLDEFEDEQQVDDEEVNEIAKGLSSKASIREHDPRLNESVKFAIPGKNNGYLFLFCARPSGATSDSFTTMRKDGSSAPVRSLQFLANDLKKAGFKNDLSAVSIADTFPFPGFSDVRFTKQWKLSNGEKADVKAWIDLLLDIVRPKGVVVFGKDAMRAVCDLLFDGFYQSLNVGNDITYEGVTFRFAPHPSASALAPSTYGEAYADLLKKIIPDDFDDIPQAKTPPLPHPVLITSDPLSPVEADPLIAASQLETK